MLEKAFCHTGGKSAQSVSPQSRSILSDAPVVWLEAGQVRIRPLGPVPEFICRAQAALKRGDFSEAEACLAVQDPQSTQVLRTRVDVLYMIIRLWVQVGKACKALPWCRMLVDQDETALAAWQVSECLADDPSRLSEAADYARFAVERDPNTRAFRKNLAKLLCRTGCLEEGVALYETLATEEPNGGRLLSDWLWYAQYSPRTSRSLLRDGYARLREINSRPQERPVFDKNRDPVRPLRVGIVSPDFKYCSAVIALEHMMRGFRRESLVLFAYGHVTQPDAKTQVMQTLCDEYRDIAGLSAEAAAALIRTDRIDVLLANGGNIRDHRLDVFPYRPAPIQIDYGGLGTLGIDGLDYRFTDRLLDPPGSQIFYTEQLLELPGGYFCFAPPVTSPLVGPLPALENGVFTFGAFNNHIKLSPMLLETWHGLLKTLPQTRLLLKFSGAQDPALKQYYLRQLTGPGVPPERIEIRMATESYYDHLACYQEVDLALDTFPFNGGITTLEGLWMGVPPISLVGNTFVGRFGLSILNRVGLDIFAAFSTQEYIEKARAFVAQPEALATIRRSLRQTLLNSPLSEPLRITNEMEQIFRRLWRHWCQENPL